jgi:hypothetical protein
MPSLVEAVRKIAADYPHYHARVQKQRSAWLEMHSPEALLRRLIDDGSQAQQRAA